MTPSASSRWMRFHRGGEARPTRLPISATEWEASCCSRARILRSMASMEQCPCKGNKCVLARLDRIILRLPAVFQVYLENYSTPTENSAEVTREPHDDAGAEGLRGRGRASASQRNSTSSSTQARMM